MPGFRSHRLSRSQRAQSPLPLIQSLERRTLFSSMTLAVNLSQNQALTVVQGPHTRVEIDLQHCAGSVTLTGQGLQQQTTRRGAIVTGSSILISMVHVTSASDANTSALRCSGIGENPSSPDTLQGVLCDVPVGTVRLQHLNLSGSIDDPHMNHLALADARNAQINIAASQGLTIQAANLTSTSMGVGGSIARFTANSIAASSLTAADVGNFSVAHDCTLDLELPVSNTVYPLNRFSVGGMLGGNWSLQGGTNSLSAHTIAPAFLGDFKSLTALSVSGDCKGSITTGHLGAAVIGGSLAGTLTLTDPYAANSTDLTLLRVHNAISDATINSAGNIGTIITSMTSASTISAGASPSFSFTSPLTTADFSSPAAIRSFSSNGPGRSSNHFSSSEVDAFTIDSFSVGSVATANNSMPFGVATTVIQRLRAAIGSKTVSGLNIHSAADVNTVLHRVGLMPGDLGDFQLLVEPVAAP